MKDKTEEINNNNKAKEYLQQIRVAEIRIKQMQDEIHTLEALVTGTSANSNSEHVISSPSQDKLADAVCHINELKQKYVEEIKRYTNIRAEVLSTIEKLDNAEYEEVLHQRYCLMKKWEEIAKDMDYSRQQINRFHGEALKKIKIIIKDVTECYIAPVL